MNYYALYKQYRHQHDEMIRRQEQLQKHEQKQTPKEPEQGKRQMEIRFTVSPEKG